MATFFKNYIFEKRRQFLNRIICHKLFRNTLVAKIRDVLDLRYVRAFCVKKMLSTKKSVNGIHAPTIGEMRFQLAKTAIHICIT